MSDFIWIRSLATIFVLVMLSMSAEASRQRGGNLRKSSSRSLKEGNSGSVRQPHTSVDLLFGVDKDHEGVLNEAMDSEASFHFERGEAYQFEEGIIHGNIDVEDAMPVATADGRIIGGFDASFSEAPWYCWLLNRSPNNENGSYYSAGCGGTLISNLHVATAAHCIADRRVGTITHAYCGAYKPFRDDNGGKTRAVIEIVGWGRKNGPREHEGFVNANNKNDVALLTLKHQIQQSEIAPATLQAPWESTPSGKELTVYGMGKTNVVTGAKPDRLQKVHVPFITRTECDAKYRKHGYGVYDGMVCAGLDNGGRDSCQGDSGGPLTDGNKLIGIVSWGKGCAAAGKPGVYASVKNYYDWFKDRVCAHPRVVSPLC